MEKMEKSSDSCVLLVMICFFQPLVVAPSVSQDPDPVVVLQIAYLKEKPPSFLLHERLHDLGGVRGQVVALFQLGWVGRGGKREKRGKRRESCEFPADEK